MVDILDQTLSVTITPAAPAPKPHATLLALVLSCIGSDGLSHDYNIIAGQSPVALPGVGNIRSLIGSISLINDGNANANLWAKFYQDGVFMWNQAKWGVVGTPITLPDAEHDLTMPSVSTVIRIDIGHIQVTGELEVEELDQSVTIGVQTYALPTMNFMGAMLGLVAIGGLVIYFSGKKG